MRTMPNDPAAVVMTAVRPSSAPIGGFINHRRRAPRLLIADDDKILQLALSRQLCASFMIVGNAFDADQAIEMAESLRPELAIVDVQMPGGGGLAAALGIRAHAPTTAIVALSAGVDAAVATSILDAGAMTYLKKGADRRQKLTRILWSAIVAHTRFLTDYGEIPPFAWTGQPIGVPPYLRTSAWNPEHPASDARDPMADQRPPMSA
jgi:CheY-like chemotaxis protein